MTDQDLRWYLPQLKKLQAIAYNFLERPSGKVAFSWERLPRNKAPLP